ncbi:MAG: RNA polymerase sigma factor [Pyrinomonadaceae bacterium]|nr:RNA polymerase sigma factor [Pyrinomonadaceae bacterium]
MAEEFQNLPERELAEKAANNDEAAFAEIVRRHSPRIFRVAARFFSRYSLVEEAAQEIFLKVFTQIGNFEARGSLEGWLTRIAVTTCINLTRSAKRQPELIISDLTEDENAWLEEKFHHASATDHRQEEEKFIAADLLNRVLNVLPPEDRLILQMIDGEGESIRDVAKLLNWSESKVKIKAFRARKRFRETIQKLSPPAD